MPNTPTIKEATAIQPLIANPTLWGNAAKLVAVVGGTITSYIFMRFWIFAGGSQDQAKEQEAVGRTVTGSRRM